MNNLKLIFMSLFVTGCAAGSMSEVDRLSAQARLKDSVPVCGESDCQRKWDAAQVWVSNNSGYKIQTATSAIIETYNPAEGEARLGFTVQKEPISDGKYRITINAKCGNWLFGCTPSPLEAAQQFNDYVNNVK